MYTQSRALQLHLHHDTPVHISVVGLYAFHLNLCLDCHCDLGTPDCFFLKSEVLFEGVYVFTLWYIDCHCYTDIYA